MKRFNYKKYPLVTIRTKRLLRAIDRYFSTKADQDGYFLNTQQKDEIEDEIVGACRSENKGVEIVSGVIVLKTKTKVTWITADKENPKSWTMAAIPSWVHYVADRNRGIKP